MRGGVIGRDGFAQLRVMQGGAVFPEGDGKRRAERARRDAGEIGESRRCRRLRGAKAGEEDGGKGHEETGERDALDELRHNHVDEGHVGVEAGAQK